MNGVGEGAARQDARNMRDRLAIALSRFGRGKERLYEIGAKNCGDEKRRRNMTLDFY